MTRDLKKVIAELPFAEEQRLRGQHGGSRERFRNQRFPQDIHDAGHVAIVQAGATKVLRHHHARPPHFSKLLPELPVKTGRLASQSTHPVQPQFVARKICGGFLKQPQEIGNVFIIGNRKIYRRQSNFLQQKGLPENTEINWLS
jgi:hypothetical protein